MTNWTQEREAAARARCDAVPKGPWETGGSIYETVDWEVAARYAKGADGRQTIALIVGGLEDEDARKIRDRDLAEFFAHARTDLPDALDENERLREELRIAENSWNFEEGKRIIGERDDLRGRLDRIEALAGELRSERAAAMKERDDLRDKLRMAEEAADVAEGKRYATYAGRSVRVWYEEVVRLRGLMSEAKKLIDQGGQLP